MQDHRALKEPSRLFESMVVVGLPPNCDIQALQRQYVTRKFEGSGKLRNALSYQNNSRVEPNLEPQVGVLSEMSNLSVNEGKKRGGGAVGGLHMALGIDCLSYTFRSYLFIPQKSSCHLNTKIFFRFASLEA